MYKQKIFDNIKALTDNEKYCEAMTIIDDYLAKNQQDDWAWYLKGNIYKKQELWQEAINAYTKAISINRENPATTMRRICLDILNFYDKTMYNH